VVVTYWPSPLRLNRSRVPWASLTLVAAACLVLAGGTSPDDEEFRYAVLTSWLHVRALSEGTYAFWTSLLGLGLPQPFIPNFWFHPFLPLLAVWQPSTWVRVLLLAHTVAGAVGMWRLGRMLNFGPMVRAACTFTFLLAGPGINYALRDAWPSHWIVWTSTPWLLLCVWRTLDSDGRNRWRLSVLLGLLGGLVIANANPAYAVVYAVVVVAVIAARWHSIIERWRPLSVSALIVLLISAPNAAMLLSERGLFPPGVGLQIQNRPLPPMAALDVLLRPLSNFASRIDPAYDDDRTLSFGGPFALLAIAACVRGRWNRRELVFGFAIGLALLFTPIPIPLASQRYQFRDPVVLCAILLAGTAAERGLQDTRFRHLTGSLLLLQIVAVALIAAPFASYAWEETRSGMPWFRGATAAVAPMDTLVSTLERPGVVAFSPRVESGVMNRAYLREGLGVNGDLHAVERASESEAGLVSLAGRRVPIVAVFDGEAGLLDNAGSVVGVKQATLAVRKFSKCGRPDEVYAYQHIDGASVVEACGKVLAETALEDLRVSPELLERIAGRERAPRRDWRELWPTTSGDGHA